MGQMLDSFHAKGTLPEEKEELKRFDNGVEM
jgi:hypothetical protein